MDQKVIDEFWRARAKSGKTRWTNDSMLDFERSLLSPFVPSNASILDLGSGFGELSKSICRSDSTLVAVDNEPGMAVGFADDPRAQFVHAPVAEYVPDHIYDVILLFGLVTYLSLDDERKIYTVVSRSVSSSGVVVVKHQCADGEGFTVDTFSEELGTQYSARYPSQVAQQRLLEEYFSEVTTVVYPAEFKVYDNSTHVAFICRTPRAR